MKEFLPQDHHREEIPVVQKKIEMRIDNRVPIGIGLNHSVYKVEAPGVVPKVIKIPRIETRGVMVADLATEQKNIDMVRKFFGDYATETRVILQADGSYALEQDWIEGTPVTSHTQSTKVRAQITDITRLNREMMRQTGYSLDFVGLPGLVGWMKHQVRSIVDKTSEFPISNLLVDRDERIHIIDNDTFRFSGVPPLQRISSHVLFFASRVAMHWYFGVDMKGE